MLNNITIDELLEFHKYITKSDDKTIHKDLMNRIGMVKSNLYLNKRCFYFGNNYQNGKIHRISNKIRKNISQIHFNSTRETVEINKDIYMFLCPMDVKANKLEDRVKHFTQNDIEDLTGYFFIEYNRHKLIYPTSVDLNPKISGKIKTCVTDDNFFDDTCFMLDYCLFIRKQDVVKNKSFVYHNINIDDIFNGNFSYITDIRDIDNIHVINTDCETFRTHLRNTIVEVLTVK